MLPKKTGSLFDRLWDIRAINEQAASGEGYYKRVYLDSFVSIMLYARINGCNIAIQCAVCPGPHLPLAAVFNLVGHSLPKLETEARLKFGNWIRCAQKVVEAANE